MTLLAVLSALWVAALVGARRLARSGAVSDRAPHDVAAVGGIVLLNFAFFWRLVLDLGWMPEGGGDNAGFLLPLYRYAQSALRGGELPLWNPRQYLGAPFAADIQASLFYPFHLLAALVVPRLSYGWIELAGAMHYALAGIGMYALLRLHRSAPARVTPWASVVGAVAYMWSDVFVVHFGNLNLVATSVWLPWMLLCQIRALRADDRATAGLWIAGGALSVGLAGTAGHPQPLLYALLVVGAYAVSCTVSAVWRAAGYRAILAVWVRTVVFVALGLGLAAVALVPAAELVGYTRRAAISAAEAAEYALQPELLVGLVAPGLFGRGMQMYSGPWPRVETGYVGVVVLLLAVACVVLRVHGSRALRRSPVWFCLVLALLAWGMALGDHTPLYGSVYELVPGLSGMRAPARFVLVADMCTAMLAALGVDALLRTRSSRRVAPVVVSLLVGLVVLSSVAAPGVLAVRGALASAGALWIAEGARISLLLAATVGALSFAALLGFACGVLSRRVLGGVVASLVIVELLVAGSSLDFVDWDPTGNHDPAAMAFVTADPGVFRVEVRPEVWGWWSPSANLIHGVDDVEGVYNPLRLSDTLLLWESLTSRSMPLYDFLNAKYVVGPKDFALPWDRFAPVYDADANVNIYLNLRSLPRALFVTDAVVVTSHEDAWEAVHDPAFDPRVQVVVEAEDDAKSGDESDAFASAGVGRAGVTSATTEGGTPSDHRAAAGPATFSAAPTPVAEGARVDIVGYRSNAFEVAVDTAVAGYLVVSDAYYPGWRAVSGDRELTVLRANYAFKAVPLTPGTHVVRLTFEPRSFRLGLAMSAASALLLALLAVASARRRRTSRNSSGGARA